MLFNFYPCSSIQGLSFGFRAAWSSDRQDRRGRLACPSTIGYDLIRSVCWGSQPMQRMNEYSAWISAKHEWMLRMNERISAWCYNWNRSSDTGRRIIKSKRLKLPKLSQGRDSVSWNAKSSIFRPHLLLDDKIRMINLKQNLDRPHRLLQKFRLVGMFTSILVCRHLLRADLLTTEKG